MVRQRYWKLTADEVESFHYNQDKLLNWDAKLIREPEEDAIFFGVFQYRHGTPHDYESYKGITYYHNHIDKKELNEITKFLKKRLGGSEIEKGERIFLKDSKAIYSGKEIAGLAKELESTFNAKATLTLEFDGLSDEERKASGLPDAKLLPIPGK